VSPFRLGFLTHVRAEGDPRAAYREALELVVAAEQLGFDAFWVAQHHLQAETGTLPAPFPFLAAAAERTRRIRLGTAVVALTFELPLRVAEDASVVDHLSDGRLELGLGSASEPEAFAAFGVEPAQARADATLKIEQVQRALQGEPLTPNGTVLQPAPDGLADRLWRGASSAEGAREAGRAGIGLLVPRLTLTEGAKTDRAQLVFLEAYRAVLGECHAGVAPRFGISRSVYPAADAVTARAHLRAGVERQVQTMVRSGRLPSGLTEDEAFERLNLYFGHPEQVATALRDDQALPHATDLLVQIDPGRVSHAQALTALERLANEVAPALGWSPLR
jgi:alkanesulfonate monooxygenase SsuD/methylene tetrahydromethanopterin reductase-like flavin-dependent oxidoreductase (luciferase family)